MSEKEYSAIYLAPPCFGFERNWCEDNAPVDCECPNGPHPWAKFVIESELTTLRAENELMREALGYYRDHSCEGYCDGFTLRICQSIQDENLTGGDCYGCRAAIALAQVRG